MGARFPARLVPRAAEDARPQADARWLPQTFREHDGLHAAIRREAAPADIANEIAELFAPLSPARRRTLVHAARSVRTGADLWNFVARCRLALHASRAFRVGFGLGSNFRQLGDAPSLRAIARRLHLDAARLVAEAAMGARVFFEFHSPIPIEDAPGARRLLVALVPMTFQFVLHEIVAPEYGPVSVLERAIVRQAAHASLGSDDELREPMDRAMQRAAAEVAGAANHADRERVATALREMVAACDGGLRDAYCIIDSEPFVIQYRSTLTRHVYDCEIVSHRCLPLVRTSLRQETVRQLDDWGFMWPHGQCNFWRAVGMADPNDCDRHAEFALAARELLWGQATARPIDITVHVDRDGPALDDF